MDTRAGRTALDEVHSTVSRPEAYAYSEDGSLLAGRTMARNGFWRRQHDRLALGRCERPSSVTHLSRPHAASRRRADLPIWHPYVWR